MTLVIGGEKKYGSGSVIRQYLANVRCTFISTNGIRIMGLFKILHSKEKDVVFFPSIAKLSALRDIAIYLILILKGSNIRTVILCDLNFSHFPKLIKWIIYKFSHQIFAPSRIDGLQIKSFRQQIVADLENKAYNGYRVVYGNYIQNEKGFDRFEKYICENDTEDYLCFGSGPDGLYSDLSVQATCSAGDFLMAMKSSVRGGKYYLYLSRFDLAPLVVIEAINAGLVVCTLKSCTDSIRILENYLGQQGFFVIDDLVEPKNIEKHITEDAIRRSREYVTNHINSLPELNELINA